MRCEIWDFGRIANSGNSAKRMYYPQTYHHIQEIQKYNIQDYRPRYVIFPLSSPVTSSSHPPPSLPLFSTSMNVLTIRKTEWNNSKRQSAKFVKSSACASSADTPSLRLMRVRRECCRRMIRLVREVGMVRWLVRDLLGSRWILGVGDRNLRVA